MFTIKFYRYNQDGSISDSEFVSCARYSRLNPPNGSAQIIPRSSNDSEDSPGYPVYTVGAPAQREEDRVPYRFDEAFIENQSGKTIDRAFAA